MNKYSITLVELLAERLQNGFIDLRRDDPVEIRRIMERIDLPWDINHSYLSQCDYCRQAVEILTPEIQLAINCELPPNIEFQPGKGEYPFRYCLANPHINLLGLCLEVDGSTVAMGALDGNDYIMNHIPIKASTEHYFYDEGQPHLGSAVVSITDRFDLTCERELSRLLSKFQKIGEVIEQQTKF